MERREESIVPLPPLDLVPPVTHYRSSWLVASLEAVRAHGHEKRYLEHLDPSHSDAILTAVAGHWVPIETAEAHYVACDALRLPAHELTEMGRNSTGTAMQSVLASLMKLAAGAGATPWTMLGQVGRIWERAFRGGAPGVTKLGPKEARLTMVGCTLCRFQYFRIGLRGVMERIGGQLSTRIYVTELARLASPTSLTFRLSWV
jgi:hypothetical protein